MSGQQHGKFIEDALKALSYSGAADSGRAATAAVDIEGCFDKQLGLDTSIKASKACKGVALADARSFWTIDRPFRLLVACWHQASPTEKEFHLLHEFIVHGGMMKRLRGSVTAEQIAAFHEGLSLDAFPLGRHLEARAWAQAQKKRVGLGMLVSLNPKIDSRSQRRLQCSVRLSVLLDLAASSPSYRADVPNHTAHTQGIGNLILPFKVRSPPRAFREGL